MKTLIKESYVSLKNRLGRVPLLYDFYENQEIDPLELLKNIKHIMPLCRQWKRINTRIA